MKQTVLKVHPEDDVIVALSNLSRYDVVEYHGKQFQLQDDIPAKHKFLTEDLEKGASVYMYGVLVGKAK